MLRGLPRPARLAVEWAATIAGAILFILVFEAQVAKPYRIPSASMEPTLHCARPAHDCRAHFSDRVLAAPIVYRVRSPRRGDVAVFHSPSAAAAECVGGGTFVKRIIGLPGEVVSERSGYVYIDGRLLHEPYVDEVDRDSQSRTWPRVPEGAYFMMGDNRADSCDSRQWGPVPRGKLIGPVVLTYWPPTRLSPHY
jgi:signal peptidase I